MFEVEVKHEGLGTYLQSFLKTTRPGGPIGAAAVGYYTGFVDKHFGAVACAGLPAVVAYVALRTKGAGIDAELHRVELEAQQARLDQQKVLASELGGEKLALALSEAEERHQCIVGRLQAAQAGVRVFRANLEKHEAAARAAIGERFASEVLTKISADHATADAAARLRLTKTAGPILDELAALDQVAYMIAGRTGVEERVEELLRTVRGK